MAHQCKTCHDTGESVIFHTKKFCKDCPRGRRLAVGLPADYERNFDGSCAACNDEGMVPGYFGNVRCKECNPESP